MTPRPKTVLAILLCGMIAVPAAFAASVNRTVTYFSVAGDTLEEIEADLSRLGPQIDGAGPRHPGATRMAFNTRITYGTTSDGRCGVVAARVDLDANMILPRWRTSRSGEPGLRVIWDTLAADIRRHEESHIVIARNHAREMEDAFKGVRGVSDCEAAAARVAELNAEILERHDRAQADFDKVEERNFERRMLRLLRNRLERMENAGELSP